MSKILGEVAHKAARNQTKKKLGTMTRVIIAARKEAASHNAKADRTPVRATKKKAS